MYADTGAFGNPLLDLTETASTNDLAKALAKAGYPSGTVVTAERQTAGRGRFGRRFFSPAGGLYFSLLVRGAAAGSPALLTSLCAASLARAVETAAPVRVGIRWVNDLTVGGRKVAGILCESGAEAGRSPYAVIGAGVNCGACDFPPELRDSATSLENECGVPVSPRRLLAAALECLRADLAALPGRAFLTECRARSVILGRTVEVTRGRERFCAEAVAIDDDGALLVRDESGELRTLISGEVSVKLPA